MLFSAANLMAIWLLFDWSAGGGRAVFFLGAYVILASFHYLMLHLFSERERWLPWLAFWSPILALIFVKYLPFLWEPLLSALHARPAQPISEFFVGISYMSLRQSYLVLEVRNGVVEKPGFWEYVGFSFFLPTLVVGPINPYSSHQRSFANLDRVVTPIGRSLLRIIVGATKYQFLAPIFNQLSYSGLLLDEHQHPPVDLFVAAVFYYLYIYCNFSGFCDIAIGVAGLLGIHVKENFKNPLAARNVQDFWNRWHITLSSYMRDVVFTPLSKLLVGRLGARHMNHAIAMAIITVFLLVGVWHGVGWNYALFGGIHALGVTANHYYTIWLKKKLGKDGIKAYNENRPIALAAVTATFIFVAASFFAFANDLPTMRKLFDAIHW